MSHKFGIEQMWILKKLLHFLALSTILWIRESNRRLKKGKCNFSECAQYGTNLNSSNIDASTFHF